MSPVNIVDERRERLIWGESKDVAQSSTAKITTHPDELRLVVIQDDDDDDKDDIQGRSPPSDHKRHSHPPRGFTIEGVIDLSLLSPSTSPLRQLSPARRRPRGSEVGRSIHKAAEAPQVVQLSPGSHSRDQHRSVGFAKRIVPVASHPPLGTANYIPTLARKTLTSSTQIELKSRKRKADRSSGNESSASASDFRSRQRFHGEPSNGSGDVADRFLAGYHLVTGETRRPSSLLDTSTPDRDQPQVARKSVVRKQLATKAARKCPIGYYVFNTLSSSGDSEVDSSESDSSSSSSSNSHNSVASSSYQPSEDDSAGEMPTFGFAALSPNVFPPLSSPVVEDTRHSQPQLTPHDRGNKSRSPSKSGLSVEPLDAIRNTPKVQIDGIHSGYSVTTRLAKVGVEHTATPKSNGELAAPLPIISPLPAKSTPLPLDDGGTAPLQPLVEAFENLSVYALHLHRTNRLPFLLRNVRTSFRAWCRELHIGSDADPHSLARHQLALTYEYTSASGDVYTYDTIHGVRECPICSIFGVFSSWEALIKHVRWDHSEIEFELSQGEHLGGRHALRLVVRLKETIQGHLSPKVVSSNPIIVDVDDKDSLQDVGPIIGTETRHLVRPTHGLHPSHSRSGLSGSPSRPSITASSQKVTTSNEGSLSSRPATPDLASKTHDHPALTIPHATSSRLTMPPASPGSRPPTPPPLSNPHGAAHPILTDPGPSLSVAQSTTYRPTGPYLYDHLSSLPLEAFGHQSWFVLDKEEEIFELTDVLDEDKVICALWGRWILLNRSFFIANYLAGVESFVDEYWLIIHQAAGWGALRAWLLLLVSRRFLKNVEMVQVLKRYNGLVGKDKWPKE